MLNLSRNWSKASTISNEISFSYENHKDWKKIQSPNVGMRTDTLLTGSLAVHIKIETHIWPIIPLSQLSSVAQSCLTLRPHGLQHARPLCPSPTPGVYSNLCPLNQWCHPTISFSVVPFFSPSIFPSIGVFSNESVLRIRWPKYWSFSFGVSPSNEYSRTDFTQGCILRRGLDKFGNL